MTTQAPQHVTITAYQALPGQWRAAIRSATVADAEPLWTGEGYINAPAALVAADQALDELDGETEVVRRSIDTYWAARNARRVNLADADVTHKLNGGTR